MRDALQTFKNEPLLAGPTTFTDDQHINMQRDLLLIEVKDGKSGNIIQVVARGEDAELIGDRTSEHASGMDLSAPSGQATASDLKVSDVVVNFQGLRAIDGVSLTLRRGEVLGLIGPNGAGKTTLVNVLTGFQAGGQRRGAAGGRRHRPLEAA